jgi:hypothetical protein
MLPSENNGVQMPSKPVDLAFLRDFKDGLGVVKEVLENQKGFFYILVGLCLLRTAGAVFNFPGMLFDCMIELATLFIASGVIVRTYKALMPGFDPAQVQEKSENRIIAASVSFGLSSTLLSLLFLMPGIWYAANSCLAAVFACLENCNAGESIKRSQNLIRGHFLTAFVYAVLKPFLLWVAIVVVNAAVFYVAGLLGPDLETYCAAIAEGFVSFVIAIFQLTVFVLLVRLYTKLKHSDGSTVSPVVPSTSLPTTASPMQMPLHEIDDSKLNPRW